MRRTGLYSDADEETKRVYNGVQCKIGSTRREIIDYLMEHHYDDYLKIIREGKIPSVDRINTDRNNGLSYHYEEGNIEIIPFEDNYRKGLSNAHRKMSMGVKVTNHSNGEIEYIDSMQECSRIKDISYTTLHRNLKRKGFYIKDDCKYELHCSKGE